MGGNFTFDYFLGCETSVGGWWLYIYYVLHLAKGCNWMRTGEVQSIFGLTALVPHIMLGKWKSLLATRCSYLMRLVLIVRRYFQMSKVLAELLKLKNGL